MIELMSEERREGAPSSARSPVGNWERPDPGGIVRRGEAATRVRRYAAKYGDGGPCYVGSRPGEVCARPAVMEVYGIPMCGVHGEEAAAGALAEIAYDLEQELQRPMNPYVRDLSPHLEHALGLGFDALPKGTDAEEREDALLLEAFPLDRDRADVESVAYAKDPDANGRGRKDSPCDAFMHARMLLCRHMRLAFEEGAHWLVETLEAEREAAAAQASYALALEIEAGLQPAPSASGGEGADV